MVLISVYNPVSGDRRAKSVLFQHTLPLLASHSIPINGVFATEHTSHAGQIVSDIIRKSSERRIQVVLCSGDGTLHDIINGISSVDGEVNAVEFILIPCGTANALYSSLFPPNSSQPNDSAYMLQSLHSYLRMSQARPLYVVINTISSSASTSPIEVLSTVVTSTCLHASILRDSEGLREEFPGVDRFKIAAQRNSNRWYSGRAKLYPTSNAKPVPVQIYDPNIGRFIDHPEVEKETLSVELKGPFIYFLSAVNVDRLEPTYVIAPRVEPTPIRSCNLIVIRPFRDPAFRADDQAGRDMFATKLWEILTAPYMNGEHVRLRYAVDGKVTTDSEGPLIVEYLRCGGWEWYPEQTDDNAHFLCSDGAIYRIPQGGKLATSVEPVRNGTKFAVYA